MAESVVQVTYARVAHDASPTSAQQRSHDTPLDVFLLKHVAELRSLAAGTNSCPATFHDPDAQGLFETLRTGDKTKFLEAAHKITVRLIGQMNGTTSEGLLVCVQIVDGTTKSAAVLKLQVVTPNAANLKTLDSGEVLLSAVTDVMDAPGKLQKGALVNDFRDGSDVIMGDLAAREAQYFPRAFGISIEQRAINAAADTLEVIKDLQGEAVEVKARNAMPAIASGTITDVLEELGQAVPELAPAPVREAIRDRLQNRPRPVGRVDTDAPLTEVITADGIQIKAPVTGQTRVTWEPDEDGGGYVIRIHVDELPRREVR
jgi:hypothetical protein